MFDLPPNHQPFTATRLVPVRGSLISWTKPNELGHAANVEQVNGDGSCYISEQNPPTGWGPNNKTLAKATLANRPSTVNGKTTYYTLRGYVNPKLPQRPGTFTAKEPTPSESDIRTDG